MSLADYIAVYQAHRSDGNYTTQILNAVADMEEYLASIMKGQAMVMGAITAMSQRITTLEDTVEALTVALMPDDVNDALGLGDN